MEDGPAKRTRSTTNVEREESDEQPLRPQSLTHVDSEVFKTPTSTPFKGKKYKKQRTPSGHTISNSVKDIRNFFMQEESLKKGVSTDSLADINSQSVNVTRRKSVEHNEYTLSTASLREFSRLSVSAEGPTKQVQVNQPLSVKLPADANIKEGNVNNQNNKQAVQDDRLINNIRSEKAISTVSTMAQMTSKEDQLVIPSFEKVMTKDKVDELRQQEAIYRKLRQERIRKGKEEMSVSIPPEQEQVNISEMCEAAKDIEEPMESIDIKIVYGMFKEIKAEMRKAIVADGENRISNLEIRQDNIVDTMMDMKAEMIEQKQRNILLSGVVAHISESLRNVESRVEKV